MFARRLTLTLILITLLAGCSQEEATEQPDSPTATSIITASDTSVPATDTPLPPADTVEPAPVFEAQITQEACSFDAGSLGREVTCYTVTVPEDHDNPENGRTIQLPVAVFKSDSPDPAPDPMLYLSGGPGEDALETVPLNFAPYFAPYLVDRDLIFFDQRGTGYSEPSLACPEFAAFSLEHLDQNLSWEESNRLMTGVLLTCHDRLAGEGVDFSLYNSYQNAADVAMLRQALGYEEWNLYGASYGTRLAQTILRDHPEGIRSVVLDSVYPLDANLPRDTPANMQRAMDIFFAACAADAACSSAYPDLETVFWDLVDELNEKPVTVRVPHVFNGQEYDILVSGDAFLAQLFHSLYNRELTSLFPRLVYEVRDGNLGLLRNYLAQSIIQVDFVSLAMQVAVQCHEEHSFTSPDEVSAAEAEFPQLETIFQNSLITGLFGFSICEQWDAGAAPEIENVPVSSDLPILILAGEHDPITPPDWGRRVGDGFSQFFFFEFPAQGHGPGLSNDCARAIVLAFLNDPDLEPDASCTADLSFDFALPLAADNIDLIPFSNEDFGISGLVPEGWIEAGPGVYSEIGTATLLQQAGEDMSAEELGDLLAAQLGLAELPESTGQQATDALTWTLYQFDVDAGANGTVMLDLALTEEDGTAYIVLLQATEEAYESLHSAVFLPVLEAFTVE